MKFALLICTYNRKEPLEALLESVKKQIIFPDELIIVDGSIDNNTYDFIKASDFLNLKYYKVGTKNRGLTKQRNYAVSKVSRSIDIVCFLDDDIILTEDYFKNLLETYSYYPKAIGVGGYILEEVHWKHENTSVKYSEFEMDGWVRELGSRNLLRKKLGLLSDRDPGFMPKCSNGLSTGFLPPSGKTYPVEYFMGGVASYKFPLLQKIRFSNYFEGYGLYEDLDFCIRASNLGDLYVNTAAKLYHYHDSSGRPNKYNYGRMVIRNGWYVWRLKYPDPGSKAILKWHSISLLLTLVRLGNVFTTKNKKEAFTEGLGRIVGWFSLYINSPKIEKWV